ncbi:MAG: ABC transporter ATP-binding protein, partial [Spirochaetaceae bacterium]
MVGYYTLRNRNNVIRRPVCLVRQLPVQEKEPMSTAIQIDNITKKFGYLTALDGVSFSVPENTIYGVLGPNGAGKTTLFSIIAGFFASDAGKVTVLGEEDRGRLRGRMSILPQNALFQANIPIIDQLTYFLRLLGRSKARAESEVLDVLKLVELDDVMHRETATLSHGMYKRLALAQAFLGEPEVIILDEPTSGLDIKTAKQIRDLIKKLKSSATVIVSSHNMDEMRELCESVAFLNMGKLVAAGPVDMVTGTSRTIDCILGRPLEEPEKSAIAAMEGIKTVESAGEGKYS